MYLLENPSCLDNIFSKPYMQLYFERHPIELSRVYYKKNLSLLGQLNFAENDPCTGLYQTCTNNFVLLNQAEGYRNLNRLL